MALALGCRGGGSDFSVVVLGTDFAVDARAALLSPADREEWHDCLPDLDELQVVRVQGTDRAGRCVIGVVGKFFPDYGIEPDPLHLADVPAVGYSLGRYEDKCSPEDRWYSGNYMRYFL